MVPEAATSQRCPQSHWRKSSRAALPRNGKSSLDVRRQGEPECSPTGWTENGHVKFCLGPGFYEKLLLPESFFIALYSVNWPPLVSGNKSHMELVFFPLSASAGSHL